MRPRVGSASGQRILGLLVQSTYAVAVEPDLIDFQIAAMSAYPHVAYQRF